MSAFYKARYEAIRAADSRTDVEIIMENLPVTDNPLADLAACAYQALVAEQWLHEACLPLPQRDVGVFFYAAQCTNHARGLINKLRKVNT